MPVQKTCFTTVNIAFEPFMVDENRYNVLYGSAGSGKSQAVAQKIIMRCLSEIGTPTQPFAHTFTVIRKYKTTILGSVFAQIKGELMRMGLDDIVTINESYHVFKFPWSGAEIRCIGLDDPEKIKSLVSSGCWVEEATELEEADFSQLDLRFRGQSPYFKQIIVTFNPIDETHWLKRLFFDTPQNGLTYILHTTFEDNYFIDDQYRQVLRDRYSFDPNLHRVYVLGMWGRVKSGQEFFFNFKYERHAKDVRWTNQLPLHVSFDFNVSPYITATINQVIKRDVDDGKGGTLPHYFVNTIDEITLTNPHNTTEHLCDAIILKYEHELKWGLYVYGDASGRARDTRSNISDYDIIENILGKYMNNYSMRVPSANPMVRKRRWFINKLFYGGFNIEYAVDKRCKKTIADFENLIEASDGSVHKQTKRDPTSGVVYEMFGHCSDTVTYLLCEAFQNQYDNFI